MAVNSRINLPYTLHYKTTNQCVTYLRSTLLPSAPLSSKTGKHRLIAGSTVRQVRHLSISEIQSEIHEESSCATNAIVHLQLHDRVIEAR